jgi:Xaa-Pro aminopeptidase
VASPGSAEPARRRAGVAAEVAARKLDALIVSAAPNVRYLSGFTGSNGAVLLAGSRAWLFTDPRYAIQAAQESGCAVRVVRGPLLPAVMKAAGRLRFRKLAFERARLAYQDYCLLRDALPLGATLEPVPGLVETCRMVKSPAEIELIRQSVFTNSQAFDEALKHIRPGVRETELAAEIDYRMRVLGAEKPAFDTIVAFGARTALPHASPSSNALRAGQWILIDMGANRQGYASDMTRVLFQGSPGAKARHLFEAVREAQAAAVAAVRPGVAASAVDRTARRVLRAHGLEQAFVHSTGHGLGLEIHEAPRIGKRESVRLEPGMVITIEPGAYIEGFGGVRIEDTVAVTASGCEVLTPTGKELLLF